MRTLVNLLILSTLVATQACSQKAIPQIIDDENVVTNHRVVVRDTITVTDTAAIQALLRCDSLGNVYMAEVNMLQGKLTTLQMNLRDGYLTAKALGRTRENLKLDSYSNTIRKEIIRHYPKLIEKRLTVWQRLYMGTGKATLCLAIPALAIWLVTRLVKSGWIGTVIRIISTNKHL